MLSGEGAAAGDQRGRCALEDDPAAVVAGARAEVDDPVGVRHHGLMMLDHDHDHDHDHRSAGIDKSIEQPE